MKNGQCPSLAFFEQKNTHLPCAKKCKKHTAWPKIKSAKRAKSVAAAKSTFKPDINPYIVLMAQAFSAFTLPETNTSHLKIGGWKMNFLGLFSVRKC